MNLTKRRAIELTRELWSWLAEHPNLGKADWPGWTDELRAAAADHDFCPCCTYVNQIRDAAVAEGRISARYEMGCVQMCPLRWPGRSDCTHPTSPYRAWSRSVRSTARRKHALALRALADRALARLERAEKTPRDEAIAGSLPADCPERPFVAPEAGEAL